MLAKIVPLAQQANPNIDEVLHAFLREKRQCLAPRTMRKYFKTIRSLQQYMNSYAPDSLFGRELNFFRAYNNMETQSRRFYCTLFGPERIIENLERFFDFFMTAQGVVSADSRKSAGTVTSQLSKWLAKQGYISQDDSVRGTKDSTAATCPRDSARRAAYLLYKIAAVRGLKANQLASASDRPFDQYTIVKVAPGLIWLKHGKQRKVNLYGPISVPKAVSKLLQKGWDISCTLGCIQGHWQFVQISSIVPPHEPLDSQRW